MEVGSPQRLETPAGTVYFNTNSINGKNGSGYLLTQIIGMDGAAVRNPITNRPHSHGAIVHRFQRGAKVFQIKGLIIAATPTAEATLEHDLRVACESIVTAGIFPSTSLDGKYVWTPPGKAERCHTVHMYEALDIVAPSGSAAPKEFTFSLVSDQAYARSLSESVLGVGGTIPNAGNAPSWPVFKVYAGGPFSLMRDDGFMIGYGTGYGVPHIDGSYIEIDMARKTMYWDGNGANALGALDMENSDFFEIPAGGAGVSCDASATVTTHDGWVG